MSYYVKNNLLLQTQSHYAASAEANTKLSPYGEIKAYLHVFLTYTLVEELVSFTALFL
jgi:hypothetical protein